MDPPRGASRRAGWRCPPRRSISVAWAWRTSLLRRPEALRLGLVPLLGVLVVPRLLGLLGNLDFDVLVVQLRLAERIESVLHPDVAGRARTDSPAGRSVLGAQLRRCFQQIGAGRNLAFRFELAARVVDPDLRHQSSRKAEYAFRAWSESSPWSNSPTE